MLNKLIEKIQFKYWNWQYKKEIRDTEDTYEFIWGVKSYDDLTNNEANLYTMNDIDVIYNKKDKKYLISIETIYQFSSGKDGEREYIKKLFDKFTEWMISKGYDTNKGIWIYDVFTTGNNINTEYDTLEDLYINFKLLVNGFIS